MKKLKDYIEDSISSDEGFWARELTAAELSTEPIKLTCSVIILCMEGTCVFSIDSRDFPVARGDEAFVLFDSVFSIRRPSEDFHVRMFIFSKDISSQAFMRFDSVFFNGLYENPIHHHRQGHENETLSYFSILESIQTDRRNRYRNLIAMNLLRAFSLNVNDKLQRRISDAPSRSSSRKEDIYSKFMDLVNVECRHHRDVAWYADRLCITSRYLADITDAVSGDSPKELIDYVLVQEIKILLTFTEIPLQEIADRINFPDQSYLGRYFRRHTGMSPTDYRRHLQDL